MNPIFQKLNFKDQEKILVQNAPAEFLSHLAHMREIVQVDEVAQNDVQYSFALVFVKNCEEVAINTFVADKHLVDDGVLWFAYPKKSSKKYKANLNRDAGWESLGTLGFEPVRQVAIDDDWSALRFREAKNIKTLTRTKKMAISEDGKERTQNNCAPEE